MNNKRWLLLGLVFLITISYLIKPDSIKKDAVDLKTDKNWERQIYRAGHDSAGTLAMLSLNGVISSDDSSYVTSSGAYNHTAFLEEIEDAFTDPKIKGVLIRINSPGGGVYESHEIYTKITALQEQYKKPYVVYMEKTAASGGYYVALPANAIYANPNTITGSIGVIISSVNYRELADKIGIEEVVFKSGANKDLLNPMRELTEEEIAIVKSIVDESYNDFLNIFIKHRGLEREKALQLADGRIYTARQAKAENIIDAVGNLEDSIDKLSALANLKSPTIYEYKNKKLTPWQQLLEMGQQFTGFTTGMKENWINVNQLEYLNKSGFKAQYLSNWQY